MIGAEERACRANFCRARVAHVAAAALIRGLLAPLVDLTREPGSSRCLALSVFGGSSDEEGAVAPRGGAALVAEIRPRWFFLKGFGGFFRGV